MYDHEFNLSYQVPLEKIQIICDQIPHSEKVKQITPMNAGLSVFLAKMEFEKSTTPSWVLRVIKKNAYIIAL